MRKLKLTKLIASLLMVTSVLALNPIRANAEWKSNPIGWWYKEGNSWAVSWRNIDGKWYYFDKDGYMLNNTTVDGCYLSSSGAWITTNLPVVTSDFTFDKATGTIIKYTGTDTTLTIPNTISGVSVKSIGNNAFNECLNLRSVTIPNSVTNIGSIAFNHCEFLTNITIPDSVTSIGDAAFQGCISLGDLTIPDSVTNMGMFVFSDCRNTFYVKSEKVKQLLMRANVASSKIVLIPTSNNTSSNIVNENKTTVLPANTNYFTFDAATGTIMKYTGTDTTLTIPSTIKGVPVKKIGGSAFDKKSTLTSVTIPDSVTSIGKCAFDACVNLTSINIPHSVTSIGQWAFDSCNSLATLIIPDSVTSIGDEAFKSCTGLKSLTIPDSVTSIGHNAFNSCFALFYVKSEKTKQILISANVASSKIVLIPTSNDTSLNIVNDNKSTVLSDNTYYFSFDAAIGTIMKYTGTDTTLTIPSTIKGVPVKRIGAYAFYKNSELTSVTIPDSVTSIETCGFDACVNLTSINIPHSVTSIGQWAFDSCHSLATLIIPDSVTSIGDEAFKSCDGLKSLTISDSVTSIGHNAFNSCFALFYVKSEKTKQLLINSGVNASKITVKA